MNPLHDRIEAYLAGELSAAETARLEQDLSDPAVAQVFRQALFLRQLMQDLPPDEPPAGLVARIQAALDVQVKETPKAGVRAWLPSPPGMDWSLLSPALPSTGNIGTSTRESLAGWSYFGQALAPMMPTRTPRQAPPARPLWRRLLFRGK